MSVSKKSGFFSPFTAFRATYWAKGKSEVRLFSARDPPPSPSCQTILDPHKDMKSEQQHLSFCNGPDHPSPTRFCSELCLPRLPTDCSERHNFSTQSPTQTRAGTKPSSAAEAQIHCSNERKGVWAAVVYAEALLLLPLKTAGPPWIYSSMSLHAVLCTL